MGQALDLVLGPHRFLYIDNPQLRPFKPQFDALLLSANEIGQLYEIFNSIDTDRSGSVSVRELFANLSTEATYFRDRVFTLFDDDGSGKIDFREFVLSLWNYCTLSKASLVMFAFDLYDTDSTGELSPEEIEGMLFDLYGKQARTHPQAKQITKELRILDSKATINVDRFRAFVTTHPALLFPAFQMQLALRQHVLGVRFWQRCAQKRIKLVNGTRITVGTLLEMNIHEEAYMSVLEAHEAAVEQEKQSKLAAFQEMRHKNKNSLYQNSSSKSNEGNKSRAKSIVDWINLQRQFSKRIAVDSAEKGTSGQNAFTSVVKKHAATPQISPISTHSQDKQTNINSANNNNNLPNQSELLLHPKDEMALLVLQVTGTHHYRRAWTQHHLRQYKQKVDQVKQANQEPVNKKKRKPITKGGLSNEDSDDENDNQPIIVPPLIALSSTPASVAIATTSHTTDTNANNYLFGDDRSSKANANSVSGPANAQLYQMLLQGDALQREHKFVEIGVINHPQPNKKLQLSNSPSRDENDDAEKTNILKPAMDISSPNGPRNSTKKTATNVSSPMSPNQTTTIQIKTHTGSIKEIPVQGNMSRQELLQWQARMVEYSGILNHVQDQQKVHGQQQEQQRPQSANASASLLKQAAHNNKHKHNHNSGGVKFIGELAGGSVISPRVQLLQNQLNHQAQLLAEKQQLALEEHYLGNSVSSQRRRTYHK